MDERRGSRAAFSVLLIEAVAVLVPILVLAALIIHLGTGGDDEVPPASVVEVAPGVASASADSGPSPAEGDSPPDPAGGGEAPPAAVAESEPQIAVDPLEEEPNPTVWVRQGRQVEILDEPGGEIVAEQGDKTDFGSPSVFAVRRSTDGWVGVSTPELPNGEIGWIRADPRVLRAGSVDQAVSVDLSDRTATLLEGGLPVRSWRVTIGAPGSETPTGSFGVTDTFRGGLNAAYGCCAVALSATQPNLPSGWMGGNRIAFHGTDGVLGEASSSGCIRSADEDVSDLVDTVALGTPVRIRQ